MNDWKLETALELVREILHQTSPLVAILQRRKIDTSRLVTVRGVLEGYESEIRRILDARNG